MWIGKERGGGGVGVGRCGWVWVGVVVHANHSVCIMTCAVFVGPGDHSKGTDHPTMQSPETGTPSCDCHVTNDAL